LIASGCGAGSDKTGRQSEQEDSHQRQDEGGDKQCDGEGCRHAHGLGSVGAFGRLQPAFARAGTGWLAALIAEDGCGTRVSGCWMIAAVFTRRGGWILTVAYFWLVN